MEVLANNIANLSTPGFKAERMMFQEYLTKPTDGSDPSSYVVSQGNARDMSQGPLTHTGNSLDVALNGAGFMTVATPSGNQYTRNGHLPDRQPGRARHLGRLRRAGRRRLADRHSRPAPPRSPSARTAPSPPTSRPSARSRSSISTTRKRCSRARAASSPPTRPPPRPRARPSSKARSKNRTSSPSSK